jgi:heterodisulfide reductase subunit A
VLEERCTGCGLCVEVCPYGAIELVAVPRAAGAIPAGASAATGGAVQAAAGRRIASVNALLCKGCGSCAATCFSGAIDLAGFTNRQIIREFEELLVR